MASISITARGFDVLTELVVSRLGDVALSGNRGELYRGRQGKELRRSFVYNEINADVSNISESIGELIRTWGGSKNIAKIKSEYNIEYIHVEISLDGSDLEKMQSIYLNHEITECLTCMGSSFGISWNLRN